MMGNRLNYKRLLVISHNQFGPFNAMGRTLESQFGGWDYNSIAQIYFYNEKPYSEICGRYFRITDNAVLKSVFTQKAAGEKMTVLKGTGDHQNSNKIRESSGIGARLIRLARSHKPVLCFLRDLMWKLGKWQSDELQTFLDDFDPECIYFASGDYNFSYELSLKIAQSRNIPLIIGCYDDFYIGKIKTLDPFYHINRRLLIKTAEKAFSYSHSFTAICDKMTEDYSSLFSKKGYTVHNSATISTLEPIPYARKEKRIVYAGNLEFGRAEQLVIIGQALKRMGLPDYQFIDVYSGEIRKSITDMMTEENGIRFHGAVSPDEVWGIVRNSAFVIHTESFSAENIIKVKYSMSTKIPDCLASGTCILAFGPLQVASINYLLKNEAAVIVTDENELFAKLHEILTVNNGAVYDRILNNAAVLVKKNHDLYKNQDLMRRIVCE